MERRGFSRALRSSSRAGIESFPYRYRPGYMPLDGLSGENKRTLHLVSQRAAWLLSRAWMHVALYREMESRRWRGCCVSVLCSLPPPPVAPWPPSVAVISGCRLHRGRQNSSSSFLPKLHLYKSLRTYLPGVEEIEHGSRQLGPFFIFHRDLKVGRRGTPWEANGALLI